MTEEFANAYSNQPVILIARCERGEGQAFGIKRRMAKFFQVGSDAITMKGTNGIYCFHIPGSYTTGFGMEHHSTDYEFAGTSSPIIDRSILQDRSGQALLDYSRKAIIDLNGGKPTQTPLSLFYSYFCEGEAYGMNDSFGIGRLYYCVHNDLSAISNNIAAIAVARNLRSTSDREFWQSYYVTGGAVGEKTYIKDIKRAPGGTLIKVTNHGLKIRFPGSLETVILQSKDRSAEYDNAVNSALELISTARPLFQESLGIGLSGGRDSRFVTALALHSDLEFQSFTAVPPDLEADIAQQLHEKSHRSFKWEIRDRRLQATAGKPPPELTPILRRAADWFEFTGGDNWPTFMRKNAPRRTPIQLRSMSLSGAFGDFTRGHYYSNNEVAAGNPESAIRRMQNSFLKMRRLLPVEEREGGVRQFAETFNEMADHGITGFHSLDYSFLVNRMRRQLPHPGPNVLLPMLTTSMVQEVFWAEPSSKLNANGLREMTNKLVPEWSNVPYFHEAAIGTDPKVTNKVTIQPTYWEVDRDDFFSSVEYGVEVNDYFDLPTDAVDHEIANLPEGRNRANTFFEVIFWHAGSTELLNRINSVVSNDVVNGESFF